jgi:SpoVK/Ycf46/Vps4 family AAA+-type ATPase
MWIDLPDEQDRKQIWEVQLKLKQRNPAKFDLNKLAAASDKFTGAEIEQVIISTMFKAYADNGKEFTTRMLLDECQATIPQSTSNATELAEMKAQAQGRLLMANDDGEASVLTEAERKIT